MVTEALVTLSRSWTLAVEHVFLRQLFFVLPLVSLVPFSLRKLHWTLVPNFADFLKVRAWMCNNLLDSNVLVKAKLPLLYDGSKAW